MISLVTKTIFKAAVFMIVGVYPSESSDVINVLDAKGIKYEIVKEIKENPKADAIFRHSDGVLVFDSDAIGQAGLALRYLAAHELIHKVRHDAGPRLPRHLEEAIAVYGAEEASDILGFGSISVHTHSLLMRTLKANGLEEKSLTKAELKIVKAEVEKTLELIKDL